MTNMEYYREQIKAIEDNGDGFAVDKENGEPTLTPAEVALVSCLKDGYIARDKDGSLYWYEEMPEKDVACAPDDWIANGVVYSRINGAFITDFDFICWTDAEPWSVEDLRKLKVKEDGPKEDEPKED